MASRTKRTKRFRKLAAGWRWRISYVLGTPIPADLDDQVASIVGRVRRQTLTSAPRIAALCDAVAYVVDRDVEGDVVECGVWRGGSMMAAALALQARGDTERDLYLFDTFTGMTEPGEADEPSPYDGYSPHRRWKLLSNAGKEWAGVSVDVVRANLETTGYPAERFKLIPGKVEETLPGAAPERISILRLDTDWYSSTKHELETLYPRLSEGGVLIIDDWGHYAAARRAVEEYFDEVGDRPLLTRIDYTGRIAVKRSPASRQ
jgi:O-methyltransferase